MRPSVFLFLKVITTFLFPHGRVADQREAAVSLDLAGLAELHDAVLQCEQRVVLGLVDIVTGVELGSTLAEDDRAFSDGRSAEHLHAEALSVGITTVAG